MNHLENIHLAIEACLDLEGALRVYAERQDCVEAIQLINDHRAKLAAMLDDLIPGVSTYICEPAPTDSVELPATNNDEATCEPEAEDECLDLPFALEQEPSNDVVISLDDEPMDDEPSDHEQDAVEVAQVQPDAADEYMPEVTVDEIEVETETEDEAVGEDEAKPEIEFVVESEDEPEADVEPDVEPDAEADAEAEVEAESKTPSEQPSAGQVAQAAPAFAFSDDEPMPERPSELRVDEMLSRRGARCLRRAFTLNDKFRFRRELFGNNDTLFAETLSALDSMRDIDEASEYISNTLGLDTDNEHVADFLAIVANHYAAIQ